MDRPDWGPAPQASPTAPGSVAQAFSQLRDTRERLGGILGLVAGDDGLLVQDFTGRIVYANEPAARLFGYASVLELLRTPTDGVLGAVAIRDESGAELPELPGNGILRGEAAAVRNLQIVASGGSPRWASVRTLAMRDDRGKLATSITVLRDITEQRLTADFRENLLAIASHDLRGPLSAISVAAGVIARLPDALDTRTARLVQQIQASTDRATRMVRDLLDLTQARIGGGIPIVRAEVDVGQLVAAAAMEAMAAHPGREVRVDAPVGLFACWDGDRITQVVANLLGNALTYGAPDRPIRLDVKASAGAIAISVQNHGTPIPAEKMHRLFEPWVRGTTGGAQRSVGLGLYIVREIVQSHGGTITASSDAEQGTVFRVSLPALG